MCGLQSRGELDFALEAIPGSSLHHNTLGPSNSSLRTAPNEMRGGGGGPPRALRFRRPRASALRAGDSAALGPRLEGTLTPGGVPGRETTSNVPGIEPALAQVGDDATAD